MIGKSIRLLIAVCFTQHLVLSAPLKFVQLQSIQSDKFVTVYWPNGEVKVNSIAYTHASTFEVHEVSSNEWQLRAMKNNMYLAADDHHCTANRSSASGWESFKVSFPADGQVQLQSHTGHWLGVDGTSDSLLLNTATSASKWETFHMVWLPQLRAANMGSWFIPEKWMFSGNAELWAGTSAEDLYTLCEQLGQEEASRRLHKHWDSWYTEGDFQRMSGLGINHVRIPMGYWDMVETWPYVFGAVEYIDKAISLAAKYGMTVLVDLHGVPGSQNGNDHSGHAGPILWPEPENVALTVKVLGMMSARWGNIGNVWGIEMMNEPGQSISHDLLTQFYRDGYNAIREHAADVHVVMCSLYGPHDWTANVLPEPQYRNAVLDIHLYTVWSGFNSIDQHYNQATQWGDEIRSLTAYYPTIVGEMSLSTGMSGYTDDQRWNFAQKEFTSFQNNAFGYVFWSDKLDYYSTDWSLTDGFSYVKSFYLV